MAEVEEVQRYRSGKHVLILVGKHEDGALEVAYDMPAEAWEELR
jgi:hypothetical protein